MRAKLSKTVTLISPSLASGGAERVITSLANWLIKEVDQVNLILLTQSPRFYDLDLRIQVYEPNFRIEDLGRLKFTLKSFFWLRSKWKKLQSSAALSFGGKYNAFVLLSALGKRQKIFISDRSRPGISYGKFLDFLNSLVYRKAAGIVAQTQEAKMFAHLKTKHKNIMVIPNPVVLPNHSTFSKKELVVLNVGRFISSKNQDQLIKHFEATINLDWELVFLGDGNQFEKVKCIAASSPFKERIKFFGNVKNVGVWYSKSAIFAFTSTSEGFPNALSEAMAHGCACVSYNCTAGPADIIEDGVNGFLIPEGNHQLYQEKLTLLMADEKLRIRFGQAAKEKMKQFEIAKISKKVLDFILEERPK